MMMDSSGRICSPEDDEDLEADDGCHHGEGDIESKPSRHGKSTAHSYPHFSECSDVELPLAWQGEYKLQMFKAHQLFSQMTSKWLSQDPGDPMSWE